MKDSLVISEKFYSIQGEGATMGIPSVFIRLAGCNLLCKSDSWVCDSIEVWQKGIKTKFEDVLDNDQYYAILDGAHLIFTGGEPLLHQKKIVDFVNWFIANHKFRPFIEVETNGTIVPSKQMCEIVSQWNCSPKLQNSGEPFVRRVVIPALRELNNQDSTIFKFVVSSEGDIFDILADYGDDIDHSKIVLMPAGETQEKLNITRPIVIEQCLKTGFKYSDRLHIVIWNQKTGV